MQSLKVYIRIAGIFLPILINMGALVYVISEDLARKLKLKIEVNNRTKVALLKGENKIKHWLK